MLRTKKLIECFTCSKGGEILQCSGFGNISCKNKPCWQRCSYLTYRIEIAEIYSYYIHTNPILLMNETDESEI